LNVPIRIRCHQRQNSSPWNFVSLVLTAVFFGL